MPGVSYGDDMVKPAPLTTETLMTAMPGGAIAAVNSDGTTEEVYGTCVKEAGVTYVSRPRWPRRWTCIWRTESGTTEKPRIRSPEEISTGDL